MYSSVGSGGSSGVFLPFSFGFISVAYPKDSTDFA